MPYLKLDDADLWYEEHGEGPPLMMVAGLGGVGAYWLPNLPAFAARYRVILHDQRGTGRSTRAPVESIAQMARDAVALLDHLGIPDAAWVGHSTGGAIGTCVALDHPGRINQLVVTASTTCGDAYRRKLFRIRRLLHARVGAAAYAAYTSLLLYPPDWINRNAGTLAEEEARAAASLGTPAVQESRLDAILDYDRRADLPRIDVPTLVVCARDDILTPPYFSEELARLIPGARLELIEWGGHAYSRTCSERFNALVLEFLARTASP
jgi:aminoacrylate hydrolase